MFLFSLSKWKFDPVEVSREKCTRLFLVGSDPNHATARICELALIQKLLPSLPHTLNKDEDLFQDFLQKEKTL